MNSASLGAAALGVLKNETTQSVLRKFVRKIWKKICLKQPITCVINDAHRRGLRFKYDEAKFQLLDLENTYLSLLSDGEVARLADLKRSNSRAWILSVKEPCKRLLNTVREHWRKERVILILSNPELATELHMKDIRLFAPDNECFAEMMESVPEHQQEYLSTLHKMIGTAASQSRGPLIEYKSTEQLILKIEREINSSNS